MERPSEALRIPTLASLGIAAILCGIGVFLWSGARQAEGYATFGSLLLAGGCLLLAGLALWFARNRVVFWVGIAVVFVVAGWKG